MLSEAEALLDQIELVREEGGTKQVHGIDVSDVDREVKEIKGQLVAGYGRPAALVGQNGAGKSTLGNLFILNSSFIDGHEYKTALKACGDYVPEAVE
eukprot:2494540-Pleurochrysis_carterae.AAC.1